MQSALRDQGKPKVSSRVFLVFRQNYAAFTSSMFDEKRIPPFFMLHQPKLTSLRLSAIFFLEKQKTEDLLTRLGSSQLVPSQMIILIDLLLHIKEYT